MLTFKCNFLSLPSTLKLQVTKNKYKLNPKMKVVTGFIYYFLLAIIFLTFSLIIFALRPFRKLLHKIQTKYQRILNNQIFNGIVYFSFAVIGIILIESIYTFFQINSHLQSQSHVFEEQQLEKLDLVRGHHGHSIEDTISTIKEYKQYYLSERNIMLTSSAFFAYFIFDRIFHNIRKLADIENQIDHPEEKSILEENKLEKKGEKKEKVQ